ncbi:sulfur carrier protein ThiS [Corynebacterium occultum]|uniref:Sulfur carrier protein ThiS n=1 Tax=Corynebacterium occultum TaxID=2675219 RepID=A0A6B8VQ55_9CORY|nr:sulfur carrier protein ThiS [Corynebacterium occultum]QGU07712.1 sulfur carrier protein ThiS [Corynebacterium occultum]
MKYTLNGETQDTTAASLSVAELVQSLTGSENPSGVAVAVNENVIPRSAWDRQVAEGDAVDVLTAVQGG